MTRLAVLLLAFALAACDAEAPLTSAADPAPVPVELASMKSADEPYVINENAAVRAAGDAVLLLISGETVEMSAGEAYLVGEALTRAGYDTMSEGLQAQVGKSGKRCEPPPPGSAVTAIAGRMYKRCPPPPPPPFLEVGVLDALLKGTAEVIEAPEDIEWHVTAGGLFAEY